jgi:hypothetical protein
LLTLEADGLHALTNFFGTKFSASDGFYGPVKPSDNAAWLKTAAADFTLARYLWDGVNKLVMFDAPVGGLKLSLFDGEGDDTIVLDGDLATVVASGGFDGPLDADDLLYGTVALARLSGIRSNEIASATDTVYRADSNAVVSAGASISVTPSTTGQVTTYTVAYTGGSGSYDINENDTHTVTSDTHMVPWSITVADGEVVRIEFFATAKGTAADCWGTLSYVGYWRRDGATMSAITMSDERNHYNKGAGLDVFVVDDTSTANTIEIRAQAASGSPSVRVMIKGHVVRNAGP